MDIRVSPTIRFDIYMAGDIDQARRVCREYCFTFGRCVHIEPMSFIYLAGEEAGFKVGIINYPRFPVNELTLHSYAVALAETLMKELCQHSCSVVGPSETERFSRNPEDNQVKESSDV